MESLLPHTPFPFSALYTPDLYIALAVPFPQFFFSSGVQDKLKGQKGKGCSRSLADGFWYTAKRERERQARGKQRGGPSLAHISWEVPAIDPTWNYSFKKITNHGLFMRPCLFSSS